MSELTKEKIYKKELEKVGGEGNNNLQRIRSLAGSGTTVVANPELSGDEADLTGLEVDGVKYAVPQSSGGNDILTISVSDEYLQEDDFEKLKNGEIKSIKELSGEEAEFFEGYRLYTLANARTDYYGWVFTSISDMYQGTDVVYYAIGIDSRGNITRWQYTLVQMGE